MRYFDISKCDSLSFDVGNIAKHVVAADKASLSRVDPFGCKFCEWACKSVRHGFAVVFEGHNDVVSLVFRGMIVSSVASVLLGRKTKLVSLKSLVTVVSWGMVM